MRSRRSFGLFWVAGLFALQACAQVLGYDEPYELVEGTGGTSGAGGMGGVGGMGGAGGGTTCKDEIRNGTETDLDCGGGACPPCDTGKSCEISGDCKDKICQNGACAPSTCSDGVTNGDETDVDCSGACAKKCPPGDGCNVGGDCAEGVCEAGVCQAPACDDEVKNGDEADIDCGKVCPEKCQPQEGCGEDADCESGVCEEAAQKCVAATCMDTLENGTETDVDCGGSSCLPCADGLSCVVSGDCVSGLCTDGVCVRKSTGAACAGNEQCQSAFCTDGVCCESACSGTCEACNLGATPGVCSDVPANTDPDNECGAPDVCNGSGACVKTNGTTCDVAGECLSGSCVDGVCCDVACKLPCEACSAAKTGGVDGTCAFIMANTDPDNECLGAANCDGAGACQIVLGEPCTLPSQCASGFCMDGVCCNKPCDGTCEACIGAKTGDKTGICGNIFTNTDPDGECANGECSGTGICEQEAGSACTGDNECQSGHCDGMTCAAPTCTDGVMNGDETGIDCGNSTCGSCFLILVAGTNNADPYVGTFDASASPPSWTTASQAGPRMTTAPSAAMTKDGYGLVLIRDSNLLGEYRYARWDGSSWTTIADVDNDSGNALTISGSPVAIGSSSSNSFVSAYRAGNVLQSREYNALTKTWSSGLNIVTLANTNAVVQPDITFRGANPYAVFIDNATPQLFYSENTGAWSAKASLDSTAVLGPAAPEVVTMSTGAVLTVFFKNTPSTNTLHSRLSTVAGGWGAGSVTAQVGGSTAYRPSLVALPNNKAALAWRDGASNNAYVSIYDGATNTWSFTAINVSGAAIDGAPYVARGRGGMLVEVLYTLNANPKPLRHARYDGSTVSTSAVTGVTGRDQIAIAASPL